MPDDEWMLAIDTSSETASLAIAPVGQDWGLPGAELLWNAGRNQTATLLTEIERLCRLAAIDPSALSAVAVATGPGSFNALRVGMSVGKGFAFALNIPIVGVGTLDAMAHAVSHWRLPVRAFVPAGRGRAVCADYVWRNGELRPRGEMRHRTLDRLAEGLLEPTVLTGDLPERDTPRGDNVVLPGPALRHRRAAVVLDLAVPRWRSGDWDDLVGLEPLYVHSQAEA